MEKRKHLTILIYEEDQPLLRLLRNIFLFAGHTLFICSGHDQSPAGFLASLVHQQKTPQPSPCDLVILDLPSTLLVGSMRTQLEDLAALEHFPILLLTEVSRQELELLPARVVVYQRPFHHLFRLQDLLALIETMTGVTLPMTAPILQRVLSWQRQEYAALLQQEHIWLLQRSRWLDQRQEWLLQRSTWLIQRRAWIDRQHRAHDPQQEWLHEQEVWVEDQLQETQHQQKWTDDNRIWLLQRQRRLDQLRQRRIVDRGK